MTWRAAMRDALYGGAGFYARGERPVEHFRTSVHTSMRYAAAMLALLREVDAALGQPARLDLVDIGAGRGELIGQVLALARRLPAAQQRTLTAGPRPEHPLPAPALAAGSPAERPLAAPVLAEHPLAEHPLAERIVAHAVEIVPRPPGLDRQIRWSRSAPSRITGLVIASEWLDNIPLDVAELAGDGPRLVLVDPSTGAERIGQLARGRDGAWLRQWWPLSHAGERAEIGRPRCAAWAGVIRRLDRGLAVAIDYGHQRANRPLGGTLTGYLEGRAVRPIPDGSRDITAHVAFDACAAAGIAAGATQTFLTSQRDALRGLGLRGRRPPLAQADSDPPGYLAALRRAAEEAELTDPAGLGGFGWLIQAAGVDLPAVLIRPPVGASRS